MCMVISFRTYVIWVFRLLLSLTCQNQERNRNKYQLVEMSKGYSMLPQERTISTIPWSAKKPDRIYFFSDEIVVTKINLQFPCFSILLRCGFSFVILSKNRQVRDLLFDRMPKNWYDLCKRLHSVSIISNIMEFKSTRAPFLSI